MSAAEPIVPGPAGCASRGADTARRVTAALALAALVAASLYLRTAPSGAIPPQDRHLITDPDSAYHVRVAQLIDAHYPRVPAFDSYLNFPAGAQVPWAFLQEFLTATVRRLFLPPGNASLDLLAFWYPAVIGSLSLALVYLLGRLLGLSRAAAGLAAVLVSLSPAQIAYTTAGRFDHNAGDLFFAPLFFVALLSVWNGRGEPAGSRRQLASACFLALSATLLFLNWTGAPIYVVVAAIALAGAPVAMRDRDPRLGGFLARTAAALAGAAALLAAVYLAAYGGGRVLTVASGIPSAFQPLLLLGAALFAGALALVRPGTDGGARRRPLLVGGVVLLAAVAAIILNSVWHGFSYYLMADNRPMMSISECRSPFVDMHSDLLNPRFSPSSAGNSLTWAAFLLPVFAWAIGRRGLERKGERAFPLLLYLSFLGVYALLTLRQNRYATMLSVPVALGAAWLATWPSEAGGRGRSVAKRALAALLPLGALAVCYWPGIAYLEKRFEDPFFNVGNVGIMRATRWLAENTPSASDPLDHLRSPDYGVLTPWDIGNNVITTGQRPVAATGFLDTLPGESFWESVRFFVEEDPEAAWTIAAANRLRYVVLHNHAKTLLLSYYTIGRDDRYARMLSGGRAALYRDGTVPVSLRLWDDAGTGHASPGGAIPGVGHFRLLWEDFRYYPGDGSVDQTKIYETVPGAVIAGTAAPGALVTARLSLVGNLGKRFDYVEAAQASPDGRFELLVPYATSGPNGAVRSAGPYRVNSGAGRPTLDVVIGEQDVLAGRTVTVDVR